MKAASWGCQPGSGPPADPGELRELAEAINTQAEKAEQRRAAEADRDRLLMLARQTVQRIREHLRVEDMLREVRQALERDLGADEAYLHVISEEAIGPPSGPQSGWSVSPGFIENMPPEAYAVVEDLLAREESLVIQDVQGPEADWMPPQLREPLRIGCRWQVTRRHYPGGTIAAAAPLPRHARYPSSSVTAARSGASRVPAAARASASGRPLTGSTTSR